MTLTVAEVAKRFGIHPRDVSDTIYQSRVLYAEVPTLRGRRRIDPAMLPVLEMELRRAGKLPPLSTADGGVGHGR